MRTVALVLALAVVPAAAGAQEPDPPAAGAQARELAAAAQRHFDLGEYDAAIAAYREAYRLDPRPGLLFNLAQAYRLAGDCVEATTFYRNYLRLEPQSKYRPLVEEHLASMEACVAERTAPPPEPQPPPERPPPAPVGAEPAPEAPAPVDAPARGRTLRTAGLVTAAGGLVVAGVGAYFALDATRAADEVSEAYARGATWAEVEPIDARGRRSERIGAVGLAVGGAAVVTGATLYVLGRRAERAPVTAVAPARGGGTVVVTWSF